MKRPFINGETAEPITTETARLYVQSELDEMNETAEQYERHLIAEQRIPTQIKSEIVRQLVGRVKMSKTNDLHQYLNDCIQNVVNDYSNALNDIKRANGVY